MPVSKDKHSRNRKLGILKSILMDDLGLTEGDLDEAWRKYEKKRT